MNARLFHVLLAVVAITGVLVAGFVARSEASSATAQMDAAAPHDAGAPAFSIPF